MKSGSETASQSDNAGTAGACAEPGGIGVPVVPGAVTRVRMVFGASLGLAMLLLTHRNWGIDHDAALYLGQGLVLRWPEIFSADLFFLHGDQGRYTLFPWLLSLALAAVDPAHLFLWGGLAGLLLFAAAAWCCVRSILPPPQHLWAWLGVVCLPAGYGTRAIFGYAEPFLTPRPFAEALGLVAIALVARGRLAAALACMSFSAILHPLQAMAAALVAWAWLVIGDRRWLHCAWLCLPVVALAWAGVEPFDGLLRRVDPDWLTELRAFNGQAMVSTWSSHDHALLILDLAILAYAARVLDRPFSRWCTAAVAASILGVSASLVLVDVLHLVLPAGLQLWRVGWIAHFLAMAALACLLLRDTNAKDWPRIALLALVLMLAWLTTSWWWIPLAILYAAWPSMRIRTRIRMPYVVGLLSLLGVVVLTVHYVMIEWISFRVGGYTLASYPLDRRLLQMPLFALGLPLLGLLAWRRLGRVAQPVVALPVLTLLLVAGVWNWDARSPLTRAVESNHFRSDLFGVALPTDAQVFWDRQGLVGPWLALGRADYFSPQQLSGIVFSRGTAIDGRKRAERMAPLIQDSLACQNVYRRANGPCAVSDMSLRMACRSEEGPAPDYLVLPYQQAQAASGRWDAVDPKTGKVVSTFWLYGCDAVLHESDHPRTAT